MLEIRSLRKNFRGPDGVVNALDDVSMRVDPGEIVVVQGRSGSGKTTLLLIAGGLLEPDTGHVLVGGDDVYALPSSQRGRLRSAKIGFVFQQFHLIHYLTVLDNILVPALALEIPDARARAVELAGRVGLLERLRHVPAELSVGERQRTAIARALLNRPPVILADEPTGNLDRENAANVLEHLAAFVEDGGSVLLVTHDPVAAKYAHRTLELEKGSLVN